MKKTMITFCLVAVSFAAMAQLPVFAIKGGVNFAGTTISAGSNVLTSGTLTTFNAGVFVDFKFANLSLQPALNYTGKGASYTISTLVPVTSVGSENSYSEPLKENLYYLQLPVNLVYHIPVIVGNIYFGAGPYIAEGISGSTKEGSSPRESVKFGNGDGDIKSTQFGADAIAGFQFKNGFLINVNYDLGLTNDAPDGSGGSSKSHVFGIAIGYTFL